MKGMKCYYTLFSKDGIAENIGNYILLFMILFFIILGILSYKWGYPLLFGKINELKENIKIKTKVNNKNINCKKKRKNLKINNKTKIKKKKMKKKKKKTFKLKDNNSHKSFSKLDLDRSNNKNNNHLETNQNIDYNKTESHNYNDYELNSLSYKEALIYDKRSYFNYYFSLLRTKHPIFLSFCDNNDYNSIILKLSILDLFLSINFAFNCFFFNESNFHKIYMDGGIYDFIYSVPQILYSFIFSQISFILIKYFFLTERTLLEIKKGQTLEKEEDKKDNVRKFLTIKYICFYVFGSLLLMFFWYYISAFCAVYHNTQIHLIKNTLISYLFCYVHPFFINIFTSAFRIISLKKEGNGLRECLYKISNILQFL